MIIGEAVSLFFAVPPWAVKIKIPKSMHSNVPLNTILRIRLTFNTEFQRTNMNARRHSWNNNSLKPSPDPPEAENKLPQRHQDTKSASGGLIFMRLCVLVAQMF